MKPFWLAAPLAICLPCLAPFALGALLTAFGVGAIGSFFTNNSFLLAIILGLGLAAGLIVGLALKPFITRLNRNRGLVRTLSRK